MPRAMRPAERLLAEEKEHESQDPRGRAGGYLWMWSWMVFPKYMDDFLLIHVMSISK